MQEGWVVVARPSVAPGKTKRGHNQTGGS